MAPQLESGHSAPLAPTKIRPPVSDERSARRNRVDTLLDNGARIGLVVAPAGYGKTTAVAQWVQQRSQPVAWFTIDVHDNSPPRFWRYVAAAIRRAVPEVGDETLGVIDDWALDGIDMVSVLLAELGDERTPMAMVMDDLHHISSPDVAEQLSFFLERSPDWLRFVLISRTSPALPIARWRALGILSDLRQDDLALSSDEAHRAIRAMPFVRLSATGEEHLIGLAAGWPAALQLAALSLRDRDDADDLVEESLKGQRLLFDYVVGEVLDRLPATERQAVLELSVLDDIDPRRCEIVTQMDDGEAMLRELVRLGLPMVALEPGEQTYRFHHLFRALVRLELRLREAPMVESIHRRAAAAELAANDHPAAVRHLLAIDDHEAAFDLVFGPVWDFYRAGLMRELSRWLDQFPPDFVGSDPGKIIRFATTLSLIGRLDDAATWNDRAAALVGDDETNEFTFDLALNRALVHLGRGDTDNVRAEVRRLEVVVGRSTITEDPDARLTTVMAIAALADGATGEASEWIEEIGTTRFGYERIGAVGYPVRRAWLAYEQGSLADAERQADAAIEGAGDRAAAHALVEVIVVKAKVAAERLAVDDAMRWAESAIELATSVGSPSRPILHHELAHEAMLAAIEARAGAELALDACTAMTAAAIPDPLMGRYRVMTAELLARAGRWDHCERLLRQIPATPRRLLVEARVALGRHQSSTAQALLDGANANYWPMRHQIEAALLRHRAITGDTAHLRRAVELGATSGFVWTFVREGPALSDELRRVVDGDSQWRATPLAAALHASMIAGTPVPHELVEPLSGREQEVLELLPTHLSTVELARRLYVSSNTIRTHVKTIYRKLGVNSRSEAVMVAAALGLIKPGRPRVGG